MTLACPQVANFPRRTLFVWLAMGVATVLLPTIGSAQTQVTRDWFPGISNERWNDIAGSRSVKSNAGSILRMLSRMEMITQEKWQAVVDPPGSIDLTQLSRAPEGYVGMAVQLDGTAKKILRVELDEGLRSSFEVERLYAVECQTKESEDGNDGQEILLICKTVPKTWMPYSDLSQPIKSFGVFITTINDGVPVFVSPGIEWYPKQGDSDNKSSSTNEFSKVLDTGHFLLASSGLNIALLDDLQHRSFVAFTPNEAPCFRSMLAAVKRIAENPELLRDAVPKPFRLIDTLREPEKFTAWYVSMEGRVRRISRVQIESLTLTKLVGQDYYYHVDFYLPVKNTNLHASDSEGNRIWLGPSFGTTLLLLQLPQGMSESESGNESRWRINGFFLKTWQHKTVDSREVSRTLRRPNPIIFGLSATAERVIFDSQADRSLTRAISLFWFGLIFFCGGLVFWLRRQKRKVS